MLVPPLGTTGIRALAEAGLLGSNVVAAHCVKADDEEIALLAEHDVAVAHCPRSNGILGCGVAPLTALREAGIRVCIATDSPASTPSFDMFDEMRAAIVGARAREGRPDALTAADALELATLGGARALGLDETLGSIVARKAGGSDACSRSPTRRSSRGKILLREPFSVDRLSASSLLSCPANRGMRREGRHGSS